VRRTSDALDAQDAGQQQHAAGGAARRR
jgi:hypothetical protein